MIKKHRVEGPPDPKHFSTAYVERQNLTIRMQMRRFTRLTNGFSKRSSHSQNAKASPAIAATVSEMLWSMEDIVALIDTQAEPARKRGPCKPCANEAA